MKKILVDILMVLLTVSCSDKIIADKAGVHSNNSSNTSANISQQANFQEWHFSTEDESFFENSFDISLEDTYLHRIRLAPVIVAQAQLKEFTDLASQQCTSDGAESTYCFTLSALLEGITLPGSEDREFALEDLSPKSLTAFDSDGLKLTSIIENNAETLQVKVTTNSSKITFRGNIRVNSKLEYILPTKTEASVIKVWESDRDGKKIKDISSESYEIKTGNDSKTSSIILNESEYWDYRTIVVEYPKEEQPLLGFQVSFEPILESLKIKWNGQACPEFSEQKIQIDPLKPNIIWALCPSLPASDELEVSISYKYQGDKNRFQISEIDPSKEGIWEVYVNDDKTGEYTIDENAIVFNNPLPEAAKVRIRYSTPQ